MANNVSWDITKEKLEAVFILIQVYCHRKQSLRHEACGCWQMWAVTFTNTIDQQSKPQFTSAVIENGCITPSSNGNIFRVTGLLCEEFTGHWWIPCAKASDAGLWCFFDLCLNKRLNKQSWGWWSETPSSPLWRHFNGYTRHDASQ